MAKKSFFKQSANVSADSTTTTLEVNKPAKFLKTELTQADRSGRPVAWGKWSLITGLTVILLALGMVLLSVRWYIGSFETASGISISKMVATYWNERENLPIAGKEEVAFLLLGLDQSENLRETSLLTDTIILAKFSQPDKTFTLYSLPRDLWIDSLKTKINALYYYGQQNGEAGGVTLLSSVVGEITGVTPDYYAVVNMDALKKIIDAIGGVDVLVERSFEDKLYPREIDLASTDMSVLYETIKFEAGVERMDGDRALKYIRSRHSEDELEGTDEGRERRQQLLLASLKQTLIKPEIVTNPTVMGNLYRVWKESFQSNLDETGLLAMVKAVGMANPTVVSKSLPVQDASQSGLIYHPQKGPANQWVYTPVDPTWAAIREWFSQ